MSLPKIMPYSIICNSLILKLAICRNYPGFGNEVSVAKPVRFFLSASGVSRVALNYSHDIGLQLV